MCSRRLLCTLPLAICVRIKGVVQETIDCNSGRCNCRSAAGAIIDIQCAVSCRRHLAMDHTTRNSGLFAIAARFPKTVASFLSETRREMRLRESRENQLESRMKVTSGSCHATFECCEMQLHCVRLGLALTLHVFGAAVAQAL